jgi:hypothetical protein
MKILCSAKNILKFENFSKVMLNSSYFDDQNQADSVINSLIDPRCTDLGLMNN